MAANRIVLLLCIVIAIGSLSRVFCVAKDQLIAPHDLTFESPNLCTIKAIQKGENIYAPALYEGLPFILTVYTPAYHYLVSWLPQHPNNRFFTGRIVAMAFMLLASFLLFFPYNPRNNVAVSILAIGSFFLIREVVSHTPFLRNDSMALFFSAAAVVLAERACGRPWQVIIVSFLCLVAFTSKQSYLAATASCFFYLLMRHRKDALIFAASSLTFFTLFGVFARFCWGNEFWFSIFVAPRNPLIWEYFVENWTTMSRQPVFVCLLFFAIAAATYSLAGKDRKMVADSPFLLYLLFSTLILTATLGKEGANVNYFFEPILAGLLWLVFFIKRLSSEGISDLFLPFLCLLGITVALEFAFTKRSDYSFTTREKTVRMIKRIDQVKREIRELHPRDGKILNLVWAGFTFEVQESPVMNDLYLYSILWNTGQLSIRPIMNNIIKQDFDIIILRKDQYLRKVLKTPYDYLIRTILTCYELKSANTHYYLAKRPIMRGNTRTR
jgi:hypothetical protein